MSSQPSQRQFTPALVLVALVMLGVFALVYLGGAGASTTAVNPHIHQLNNGIYTAVNITQNCSSSTTAFVLCADLSPSSWLCSTFGCNSGFQMNVNSTAGFFDALYCISTFTYSFST